MNTIITLSLFGLFLIFQFIFLFYIFNRQRKFLKLFSLQAEFQLKAADALILIDQTIDIIIRCIKKTFMQEDLISHIENLNTSINEENDSNLQTLDDILRKYGNIEGDEESGNPTWNYFY